VRASVLEATLDELVERGYTEMTVQGIADRAGVNKTSLYRRWRGKGGLLAEALRSMSMPTTEPPDTGSLRRDLLVLWQTAPRSGTRGDVTRAVAVSRALAAASVDPIVAEAHARLWRRRLELVGVVVDRAVQRGEVPAGADPELLMDLLFGPFHARVIARGCPANVEFLIEVMEAALHAIGASPEPGGGSAHRSPRRTRRT
jgi:AcrR family transcriptional regulator